ncbi:MAG: flotillin-like FloA family protein, partial [Fuerstiella sp.]|nr:flotillin-like FloA family protein [Fuerstiella sp.]
MSDIDPLTWFIIIVVLLGTMIVLAIFAQYASLWLQCKMTRVRISLLHLVMMRLRKVNPVVIVRCMIMAVQSGLSKNNPLNPGEREAHYIAGGNVPNVIRALIASQRADINLDWQTAQAIDLAGRDILEAVRTSVYPKVIDCPDSGNAAATLDA